jgi:hypothetical protein
VAFTTSTAGNGNLSSWGNDAGGKTGLAAGDAICQARAAAGQLVGAFTAWLSDSHDDAYCRIHGLTGKKSAQCGQATLPTWAGPWIRMDGFPFGETIGQIVDSAWYAPSSTKVYSAPRFDEFGNLCTPGTGSFTGTFIDGAVRNACSDWTSSSSSTYGTFNDTHSTTQLWTIIANGMYCSSAGSLLCLQSGAGPALPSFASAGKKAFVTSVTGAGNLSAWADAGGHTGLAAGDAICQKLAQNAGFANYASFKAWLSDGTTSAKDRITSDGPWVRPDGVRVASSKSELLAGSVFSSVNRTELGTGATYLGYGYQAWTGTDGNGSATANNCTGWTSNLSAASGRIGDVPSSDSHWTTWLDTTCDSLKSLYCFED